MHSIRHLNSRMHELEIKYRQGSANSKGYVQLRAVPITDHSQNVELNEDGSVKLDISGL